MHFTRLDLDQFWLEKWGRDVPTPVRIDRVRRFTPLKRGAGVWPLEVHLIV